MAQNLIQISFPALIVIVFLYMFILTNTVMEREINHMFYFSLCCALVLVFADAVELWTASLPTYIPLRTWMSAIGYSLRPFTLYWILVLFLRNHLRKRLCYLAPAIVNVIVAFSALYTDVAYSYTKDNEFVRGPLGYTTHFICGVYLIILLIVTIRWHRAAGHYEVLMVIMICASNVLATMMETIFHFDGLLNVVIALSINTYYLFLNTQNIRQDPLTKVFNRRSLYLDEARNQNSLSAVVSLDVNHLKQINDIQGHAQGDRAICTIASCVRESLLKECFLYRTGGDEFMVLCFHKSKQQVEIMMEEIRRAIAKTEYTCAMGMIYVDQHQEFDQLCAAADEAMYEDKRRTE